MVFRHSLQQTMFLSQLGLGCGGPRDDAPRGTLNFTGGGWMTANWSFKALSFTAYSTFINSIAISSVRRQPLAHKGVAWGGQASSTINWSHRHRNRRETIIFILDFTKRLISSLYAAVFDEYSTLMGVKESDAPFAGFRPGKQRS